MLKCLLGGVLIKIVIGLLGNRLDLNKVLKNHKNIQKFGLMCCLFSFLYNITRFIIRKYRINISQDREVFLASIISSLSLFIADPRDRNLMKVALYPRAIEAVLSLL